jgi:hypothetical protein
MYGRNYIETNKGLDVYRKRCVTLIKTLFSLDAWTYI